ncbi:unnamed protein product [Acanthoscelides obtectus]|uniref:Uncharacterized protein n=1 Tax=Acanthoscelides obtectus TaxID=200917 RepID=A0A9P0LRF5_ACAOB|nr:unnamed protein product [Acanthoscelides obtectus]CAK1650170.1 hypothetical protein AOBTE_LOCUS16656 [Acanthoscelides obtectus]
MYLYAINSMSKKLKKVTNIFTLHTPAHHVWSEHLLVQHHPSKAFFQQIHIQSPYHENVCCISVPLSATFSPSQCQAVKSIKCALLGQMGV